MNKLKNIKNVLIGLIIILINTYWIGSSLQLMYLYHCTAVLFLLMIPDWLLILNVVSGFIGIYIGIKTIKKGIKIQNGVLINLILWSLGGILHILISS